MKVKTVFIYLVMACGKYLNVLFIVTELVSVLKLFIISKAVTGGRYSRLGSICEDLEC